MVYRQRRRKIEKYDDGKLHGSRAGDHMPARSCRCGTPQAKWGISHVKTLEHGDF
jgi:hypothetical protein